jgi:hypothetical protein
MARISAFVVNIFASAAPSTDVQQFASFTQTGTPNYTADPTVIQAGGSGAWWAGGWSEDLNGSDKAPYKQSQNAVDKVLSEALAYLQQQGIGEWQAGITYYANPNPSIVQYNGGQLYQSLQDGNVGNAPPASASNAYWAWIGPGTTTQPTRTVLTSGSGTYTTPTGCTQIRVRAIGAGGGGAGGGYDSTNGAGGGTTTFGAFTAVGGSPGVGYHSGTIGAGAGGAGGTGGSGTASVRTPGTAGGCGLITYINGSTAYTNGGAGGGSPLGGGGAGDASRTGGGNGANGGGGGGGSGYTTALPAGGGGGAGEAIELVITGPASTYSYAVGAGGAGGAAGATGGGGGTGGNGIIIVDEIY